MSVSKLKTDITENARCECYLYLGQLRSPDSPVSLHPSEPKEQLDPPLAAAGLYSLPAGGAPDACTPDSHEETYCIFDTKIFKALRSSA